MDRRPVILKQFGVYEAWNTAYIDGWLDNPWPTFFDKLMPVWDVKFEVEEEIIDEVNSIQMLL